MKSRNTKKTGKRIVFWKEKITFWRLGDYIRQLSIVILGIIITFAASDAINRYSQTREITNALRLLKKELELNKEKLSRITSRIEMEQRVCSYILQYQDSLEKIPADTLQKYKSVPLQSRAFLYTKDAMEWLKGSSLFQKITPQTLALQIIKTYNDLETTALNVRDFYNVKTDYMNRLINDENFDAYGKKRDVSVREYWKQILSSNAGWNLCNFTVHNFTSIEPFQEVANNLEQTIGMLSLHIR